MNTSPDSGKALVAIRCITYNHEPYICDALEGFVMQKTTFPFVAIVHDDASTDGTAAIIREYAEKYPDIIKPIYETENQYSKRDGSLRRIMNEACEATGAKYIALCEGDDYWTDPLKLQKQVDFLESHPDYSMCFHEAGIKNETNNEFHYPDLEARTYNSSELFENWIVPTASIMYRFVFLKDIKWDSRFINGDIILILSLCEKGLTWGMPLKMSTYRVQSRGLTISRLKEPIHHYLKEIHHFYAIMEHFPIIPKSLIYAKICNSSLNAGMYLLRNGKLSGLIYIIKSAIISPKQFYKRIQNRIHK